MDWVKNYKKKKKSLSRLKTRKGSLRQKLSKKNYNKKIDRLKTHKDSLSKRREND